MPVLFTNNATSTLAVAINASATTVTVEAGHGAKFPSPTGGDWFPLVLESGATLEYVKCTGRTGDNLTVVRAQEGSSGASFPIGARVDLRATAAAFDGFATSTDPSAKLFASQLLGGF